MKAVFNLEGLNNIKMLEDKIKKMPQNAEIVINNYLHNKANSKVINNIRKEIPKSSKNKRIHAKDSDSLRSANFNLGFMITSNKKFNYLVFPAMGLGKSHKNKPNDFMNRGLNKEIPNIIGDLEKELEKKMEEKI